VNKKIIIIGAGFGGVALAKALRKTAYDVLLIDKNNYHTFQPLLYQVATGGLEANSIAYPVRRIFRGSKNVSCQMAEVLKIDYRLSTLDTSLGQMAYDFLVIASGSTNNFFNFEPKKQNFLPLKTIGDALDIRSYLMQNLEQAIFTFDPSERNELINIAIVGGGPAGIELAGSLAEMKKFVLPRDFPQIDFDKMTISLFEASSKLLSNMSENASRYSLKYLEEMGIVVRLNAKVKEYDNHKVYLEDGTEFPTDTVIWTAGVKGNPIEGLEDEHMVSGGRIAVNALNEVVGLKNIFAIGDVAACIDPENPRGLPMLATVAIQQAKHLAANFVRADQKKLPLPFEFQNKGTMATVGRNKAVVDLPRWKFQGALAWFVWMFVHVMSLVGFRNKIIIFIDWAANYWNYDRPLGLIIRPFKKKES
jgi:NADH dehydrogenase